jgi:hypothetical protein
MKKSIYSFGASMVFCLNAFLLTSTSLSADLPINPSYQDANNGNGNSTTPTSVTTPGLSIGGISLDDSQFYEIKPEKCKGESVAEILNEYSLTEKLFVFKTENGFGIMSLEPTLKEIETGVRRNRLCTTKQGLKLKGEIDCRGVRVIKQEPYEGCAYEAKIWEHGLSQQQAFNLVYDKLKVQFKNYRADCILPPKPKSLSDRMIKF